MTRWLDGGGVAAIARDRRTRGDVVASFGAWVFLVRPARAETSAGAVTLFGELLWPAFSNR